MLVFPLNKFGKIISNGKFLFPEPKCVPFTDIVLPHVFVKDEAYEINEYYDMRPYPQEQLRQISQNFSKINF